MATLSSKHSRDPIKLILIGDSGSGKTGALGSLVRQLGLELFVLDYDNGTDILETTITKLSERELVHVETLTDTGKLQGVGNTAKILKLNPQAFPAGLTLLQQWRDKETGVDYGPVSSWDTKRVLVVDSLTFMGGAALDWVLAKNGRLGESPWESDWGEAMRMLEQTLQILYSTEIKCHVIVLSHVDFQAPAEGGAQKGLPMALGKKLSPKVGRYFNMLLQVRSNFNKREILTKPTGLVEVKCPLLDALPFYPVETGLADIFKLWNDKAKAFAPAPLKIPEVVSPPAGYKNAVPEAAQNPKPN